ncbi:hypothetical protein B6A10_12150 [Flavobacterium sp. L1I52]|uniref:Uncharacterized protein n=1 Tax=Flavobacterium pokkalii TaxID=1940408 RepID=A0ABR7UVC4_9FLAO|nr:hypothetical protein [Flavobacterium pokkalii]MBD0725933.1 hypothetical protein [Flavobacterium pokkalii]
MEDKNNIYSISAFINLLGFSSHLEISSYDVRTKIGKEAIERLKILEEALDLTETAQSKNPQFFPKSFRISRFNDALILGMDIESEFLPAIGKPDQGQTFGPLNRLLTKKSKSSEEIENHFSNLSFELCQFIGIVSRIHNYINDKESQIHMPGCRSVISSGMRYKFIRNKDKKEDYFSANFSFSNAYKVNEMGSKYGFEGNKCYLENNVAKIAGGNSYCKRAIGLLKFIYDKDIDDVFNGKAEKPFSNYAKYTISNLNEVILFRKKYYFREIDTIPGGNLQLFPEIINLIENESYLNDSFSEGFFRILKK